MALPSELLSLIFQWCTRHNQVSLFEKLRGMYYHVHKRLFIASCVCITWQKVIHELVRKEYMQNLYTGFYYNNTWILGLMGDLVMRVDCRAAEMSWLQDHHLRFMSRCETLHMRRQITFSSLDSLPNLSSLEIDAYNDTLCNLDRLSGLSNLSIPSCCVDTFPSHLRKLQLCGAPYDNEKILNTNLSRLMSLSSLSLSYIIGGIDDTTLIALSKLTSLYITGDVPFNANNVLPLLTSLKCFSIVVPGASITNHTISQMTHLESLCVVDATAIDGEGIGALTELTALGVYNTKITDDCISRLTALTELNLSDCPGVTRRGLRGLTRLDEVMISQCDEDGTLFIEAHG